MSYGVTAQFSAVLSAAAAAAGVGEVPPCLSAKYTSPGGRSPSSALDFGVGGGGMKWKSRRELMDWLSSIISEGIPCVSVPMGDRISDDEDAEPSTVPLSRGLSSGKMRPHSKEFSWLGPSWDCKKRRRHYRSFCRNGIIISVHDFVHVMAEDYKRLIAYVEDLYDDMRSNKMVVVRWFHKVDEVGIVLPPDVNDREIFSSPCLQDLSIECIDGRAAVLSAQDFDKFQSEERHRCGSWEPYLCRRKIDNDDIKVYDITQVQGYWSQELLRSMYSSTGTSLKLRLKITHGGSKISLNGHGGHMEKTWLNGSEEDASQVVKDALKARTANFVGSRERHARNLSSSPLLRKELLKQKLLEQQKHLAPGCHVEVLSHDSGIRGCWFRCVVMKRHHDKVKVQYRDVQDAENSGNLEEWVLSSRVALPDKLGVRFCGRPVVRPDRSSGSSTSNTFDVGSVVDAWWHDGWWEGIVISKELEGKIRVYFPGEQQVSVFGLGDLKQSQEWVGNKWNHVKDRQDVANSLLSDLDRESRLVSSAADAQVAVQASGREVEAEAQRESSATVCKSPSPAGRPLSTEKGPSIFNLSDVCHLATLKWSSSRKRRRPRELGKGSSKTKKQCASGSSASTSSSQEEGEAASSPCGKFHLPKALTVVVDQDNCKIGGTDPLLVPPMSLCSSLVMSQ